MLSASCRKFGGLAGQGFWPPRKPKNLSVFIAEKQRTNSSGLERLMTLYRGYGIRGWLWLYLRGRGMTYERAFLKN
jgi:hypothetical protein